MPFDAVTPWAVTVDWSLTLNAADTTLYQKMATAVSGYANIPGDRTSFYSSLNNPPNLVINGWSGMVNNVQTAAGGGYVVTVAVFPDLTTAAYGEHTTVSSEYSEQFGVDSNGNESHVTFSKLIPGAAQSCTGVFSVPNYARPFPPIDSVGVFLPPPVLQCQPQRPGINVTPAIAPDGTVYVVSRANNSSRFGYLVAVTNTLEPKWATSLRGLLHDGCGVTIPSVAVPNPETLA